MTWNGREEEAERQLFDAEDGRLCRLAVSPRPGPMAENSLKIRETRRAMHQGCTRYALRKGDRSRIIISSRRSAVFLVIHISFHERIFVRLDCDD